jgi:hypothetical protein
VVSPGAGDTVTVDVPGSTVVVLLVVLVVVLDVVLLFVSSPFPPHAVAAGRSAAAQARAMTMRR